MKSIWITWEQHRRTRELALSLDNMKLFELEFEAPFFIRYPYLLFKTVLILFKERPNLVVVQNPSVVLSLFMVTFGKLFTNNVLVDAHNEGIMPFYSKYNWLLPAYKLIQKHADLTIVTNENLADYVRLSGGHPFVLEDKIPRFNDVGQVDLKGDCNIVFICTFEKDEPYEDVIKAASLIDTSIYIYITGNYEKLPPNILENASPNLIFTGYLPQQDYENLLYSCDAVIDLTLMGNCLVCGAYEAVSLEKPIIVSNTNALRNYFCSGAVYTENRSNEIAAAIDYVLENKESIEEEIKLLKHRLQSEWMEKIGEFVSILDQFANQTKSI